MSSSYRIQQGVVILFLALHVAWIANHLRWTANEQINPWKAGGYGMYTGPVATPKVFVEMVSPSGATAAIDTREYSLTEFGRIIDRNNINRIFRCAPIPPEAVRAFFDENPKLRGVDLSIVFTEIFLSRNPVEGKRREQGRVQVQWIRHDSLVYGSLFCGNVETDAVSWP